MKNIPPHLPPPTCSVPLHKRFRTLQAVGSMVAISMLAGFAGGAALLAWVWPRYVGDGWLFVTTKQNTKAVLSDVTMRDLSERMATMYTRAESLTSSVTIFSENNVVGDAVIVSSDGWLALPLVGDTVPALTSALLSGQKLVKVEKVVADKEAKIVYVKVAAPDLAGSQSGQFKIISFADTAVAGDDVFVFNRGSWQAASLLDRGTILLNIPHIDSLPVPQMRVVGSTALPGSLVVTVAGKWVGYVGENGLLIPAESVARVVGSVLVNGVITYKSLGVDGWFSGEVPVIVNGQIKTGFLVNKIRDKATKLKRGDIVLEIGGAIATPDAWIAALTGNEVVSVRVLRQGVEMLITTPVVTVGK